MHVEMAVDALRLAPQVDHIVLFAGEGSFRSLVEALQQLAKRVTVISTLQSRPPMVADELRRQADQFVDLADLEPMIGRARTARPPMPAMAEPLVEDEDVPLPPSITSNEPIAGLENEASGAVVFEKRTTRPRKLIK